MKTRHTLSLLVLPFAVRPHRKPGHTAKGPEVSNPEPLEHHFFSLLIAVVKAA